LVEDNPRGGSLFLVGVNRNGVYFRALEQASYRFPIVRVGIEPPEFSPRPNPREQLASIDRGGLQFARAGRSGFGHGRPAFQYGYLLSIV
jgi:hypothetical protein